MQDEDKNRGESQRPDGAHRRSFQSPLGPPMPRAPQAAPDVQDTLRRSADGLSDAALAKLQRLVFGTMAGSGYALEELRVLWSAVQLELPPEQVSQAREDYLSFALTIWTRYLARELPDPGQAVAVLEVMCLLFDD